MRNRTSEVQLFFLLFKHVHEKLESLSLERQWGQTLQLINDMFDHKKKSFITLAPEKIKKILPKRYVKPLGIGKKSKK